MIYPRLDKVRNGQRMSVGLVNGLIKRTEYAADLLRQYNLVAGTKISVAQREDGTIISAVVDKYFGYRKAFENPSFAGPSENDILLELDKVYTIPATPPGVQSDYVKNNPTKIVYPDFMYEPASYNAVYGLLILGGYWADFNLSPDASGFYPSISNFGLGALYFAGVGTPLWAAWGGHPNINGSSAFEGGSISLVRMP